MLAALRSLTYFAAGNQRALAIQTVLRNIEFWGLEQDLLNGHVLTQRIAKHKSCVP